MKWRYRRNTAEKCKYPAIKFL